MFTLFNGVLKAKKQSFRIVRPLKVEYRSSWVERKNPKIVLALNLYLREHARIRLSTGVSFLFVFFIDKIAMRHIYILNTNKLLRQLPSLFRVCSLSNALPLTKGCLYFVSECVTLVLFIDS